MKKWILALCLITIIPLTTSSCRSISYGAKSMVGIEKRDILQSNVSGVKKLQEGVQNQFTSALDSYMAVVNVDGGDLEKQYRKLDKENKRCAGVVAKLEHKVKDFDRVSRDLVKEWKKELKQYSNKEMRQKSASNLKETEKDLNNLLAGMEKSVASAKPVLTLMDDQVLFLKHNLNSQAIAGLKGESIEIKKQVNEVIASMEASMAESQAFIDDMGLMD